LVRDDAHLHIGTAAGGKRNDNAKPARGPILGGCHARKRCQQQQRKHETDDLHGVSSVKNSNAMRLNKSASVLVRAWPPRLAKCARAPGIRRTYSSEK